jgi:hypothetical protein
MSEQHLITLQSWEAREFLLRLSEGFIPPKSLAARSTPLLNITHSSIVLFTQHLLIRNKSVLLKWMNLGHGATKSILVPEAPDRTRTTAPFDPNDRLDWFEVITIA